MNQTIVGKVNCAKIEKAKLFPGKNDAKWLDIVLIPTPTSEYGDYMIVQGSTREERAKGIKSPILGNAKILHGGAPSANVAKPADKPDADAGAENDVPF